MQTAAKSEGEAAEPEGDDPWKGLDLGERSSLSQSSDESDEEPKVPIPSRSPTRSSKDARDDVPRPSRSPTRSSKDARDDVPRPSHSPTKSSPDARDDNPSPSHSPTSSSAEASDSHSPNNSSVGLTFPSPHARHPSAQKVRVTMRSPARLLQMRVRLPD